MIVTHTQNTLGERRIYVGGKSSVECWLEPAADGKRWTFHWAPAVTGQQLDEVYARQSVVHLLKQLAEELDVAPADLAAVPFGRIAALHVDDPFAGRRIASGRRRTMEQDFMAKAPTSQREPGCQVARQARYQRPR